MPDPDSRSRRSGTALPFAAGRRRWSASSTACRRGASTRAIARRSAGRSRGCIWPARIFGWPPAECACRSTAGGRCSRPVAGAPIVFSTGSRPSWPRTRRSRAALAERSAAGRDPCRSVPGQRVLPGPGADRDHRLLLRLRRHHCLRSGDLPERLVLRARRRVQHHQGAPDAGGVPRPAAVHRPPSSRLCRCSPAGPRCASC